MIILEYSIKNAGRIKLVSVKPKPAGVTTIGGRNRQGKTTNLDALCWALGGDRYKPEEPNRRGGDGTAEIDIRTDNGLHIQRKGKTGKLHVTDETTGQPGNQSTLDKFITTFALDIRQFRNAKGRDRCDLLLKALHADVEYAACEARIKEAYDQRTVANRIAKAKEAAFAQAPRPGELPCDEPIDVDGLLKALQLANQSNTEMQNRIKQRELLAAAIRQDQEEIGRLETMLLQAKSRFAEKIEKQKSLPSLPDEIPTQQLQRDIANATSLNAEYSKAKAARDNYERTAAEVRQANKAAADADATVEQARQAKDDLLASLAMPDPDIGVRDGELTYKGDTWDQLADSDELILCSKIVSRLNPECRLILLDGLEKLDEQTSAEFDAWARSAGLQVIGTRVTTDASACDIIIEDGEVASPDTQSEAA